MFNTCISGARHAVTATVKEALATRTRLAARDVNSTPGVLTVARLVTRIALTPMTILCQFVTEPENVFSVVNEGGQGISVRSSVTSTVKEVPVTRTRPAARDVNSTPGVLTVARLVTRIALTPMTILLPFVPELENASSVVNEDGQGISVVINVTITVGSVHGTSKM